MAISVAASDLVIENDPKRAGNFLYVLKCPESGRIRYVGITTQRPERRLRQHLVTSAAVVASKTNHRLAWIRSLKLSGRAPVMCIVSEHSSVDELKDEEVLCLRALRLLGCDLVNNTDGGDGTSGITFSEDSLRRMSESHLGKKRPPEQVDKQRMTMASKSAEDKAEYSEKLKAAHRNRSPEKEAERVAKILLARTPEFIAASNAKAAETRSLRTEEQKAAVTENCMRGARKRAVNQTGVPLSESHRKNLSLAKVGKKQPKEQIAKRAAAVSAHHKRRRDAMRVPCAACGLLATADSSIRSAKRGTKPYCNEHTGGTARKKV